MKTLSFLPTPPSEACEPQNKDKDTDHSPTIPLRLASGNGPITIPVLRTVPRDATPSEIPIIDVSGIFSPFLPCRLDVARRIRAAATNTGFFYISHHGVTPAVTDAAHEACLAFFRQPAADKMRAAAGRSAHFNGYKPPRSQRINPFEGVDARETFSWTYDPRLDPDVRAEEALGDVPEGIRKFLRVEPDPDRDVEGHEEEAEQQQQQQRRVGEEGEVIRFPWTGTTGVPGFRHAVLAYWRACLALARALVRSFALSLDLEEDFFDAKFSHPDAALALNYYPPLPADNTAAKGKDDEEAAGGDDEQQQQQQQQQRVSIGSHTDFQLFTILWQDPTGGLQVLNRGGQWVRAPPVRDTLVVNMADYMQRITNGRYRSTVHRARNTSGRERVSMPFFFGFNLNESCGVLPGCVGAGEAARYEEVGCWEWVRRRVRMMHDTGEEGGGGGGGAEEEEDEEEGNVS